MTRSRGRHSVCEEIDGNDAYASPRRLLEVPATPFKVIFSWQWDSEGVSGAGGAVGADGGSAGQDGGGGGRALGD